MSPHLLNPWASATAAADARLHPYHAFSAHLRQVATLDEHAPHQQWSEGDSALPALYLSHGAPPTFEDAGWMHELLSWSRSMPKPKAILIVSAHWESDALGITSAAPTDLVYDFGGFDPAYFQMRYDTPDASGLAAKVAAVMSDATPIHEHRERGLDHGAWVPLKVMYPHADVPVLQLSLPLQASVEELMALGARLRPLRSQGVLVIGSGFMTHGLRYLTREMLTQNQVPRWSSDFDAWAQQALAAGDVEELSRYRDKAPALEFAHPTEEHFTPLFVTLGAATDPEAGVTTTIDGFAMGLAKRSFQVV